LNPFPTHPYQHDDLLLLLKLQHVNYTRDITIAKLMKLGKNRRRFSILKPDFKIGRFDFPMINLTPLQILRDSLSYPPSYLQLSTFSIKISAFDTHYNYIGASSVMRDVGNEERTLLGDKGERTAWISEHVS
jgi:hypothetical protein